MHDTLCIQLDQISSISEDSDYMKDEIEQLQKDLQRLRTRNKGLQQDLGRKSALSDPQSPECAQYESNKLRKNDKYDGEFMKVVTCTTMNIE